MFGILPLFWFCVLCLFNLSAALASDVPSMIDVGGACTSLQAQSGIIAGECFLLFCGVLVVLAVYRWVDRAVNSDKPHAPLILSLWLG